MSKSYFETIKNLSLEIAAKSGKLELTKHQKIVFDTIGNDFGCKNRLVQNFASAFFNIRHHEIDNSFTSYCPGTVIVPLNGYSANQALCVIIGDNAFNPKNCDIQTIKSKFDKNLRLATKEEILNMYKNIENSSKIFSEFMLYMERHSAIPHTENF